MKVKCFLFILSGILIIGSEVEAQSYTWAENAACIFYTNCTKCHFPGGPGPFSLLDYTNAYNARFTIKDAILTKYMPPWPADENYQTYAHERLLTQTEKDIIVAWVDQGGAQGNLANAPTPPTYSDASQLGVIDFTGNVGNYTNSTSLDDWRCFLIPTHLGVDKYIESIELIPGTGSMVHYALIYCEEDTNSLLALDAGDPGPGYYWFGGTGVNTSKLISVWNPGGIPLSYPNGMGVKLPANAYLVLRLHYPSGTNGDTDSNTVINLKFAGGVVREVMLEPLLNHFSASSISPFPLYIGANSTASFVETDTLPSISASLDSFTVLSIVPHIHKVGMSIKSYAIKPGNDTVPLIDIPDWDYMWQVHYVFRLPLVFPEGTILKAEATYDNTSANLEAPNPNAAITDGEAMDQEMMMIYFSYLSSLPGDQNIIVDTVTIKPTYNGCQFVGINEIANASSNFKIYPNPTSDFLNINFDQLESGNVQISLIDLTGKIMLEYLQPSLGIGFFSKSMDVRLLPNGMYFVKVSNGNEQLTRPFIIAK